MSEYMLRALADTQTDRGSSYWDAYTTCQRRWHLEHVAKLVAPEALSRKNYFAIGSLVHAVLRYEGEAVLEERSVAWPELIDFAVENDLADAADAFEVSRIMPHYFAKHGSANAGYGDATLESVETELRYDYGDGAVASARADAVVRIADERFIVDHKTTAQKLSDDFEAQCRHRPQFLRMLSLARRLGIAVDGILVNSIVKTKEPKFNRLVVRIPEAFIDAYEENLLATAAAMRDNKPVANFSACMPSGYAGGGACSYRLYCFGTEEQRSNYGKQD